MSLWIFGVICGAVLLFVLTTIVAVKRPAWIQAAFSKLKKIGSWFVGLFRRNKE